MGRPREAAIDRFERLFVPEPNSGCWLWLGVIQEKGYGKFRSDPTKSNLGYAHRFSYENYVGPIPEGLTIDHLCRNRSCVNPAHLEPVTNRENLLRGFGIGVLNKNKTHCKNGHEYSPENTYYFRDGSRRSCRVCRKEWRQGYIARKNDKPNCP